jgi:predicted metal-binding protein
MYKTEEITKEVSTKYYFNDFVDIDYFLEYCYNCKAYNKNWACPPFDFDPRELWKSFDNLLIIGLKISFNEDILNQTYSSDDLDAILKKSLRIEKNKLVNKLFKLEKEKEGSLALFAGRCTICDECSRQNNENCKHPDKLRHSIESLGGNVEKTLEEILDIELKWIKDYKLPEYLMLCFGLLY